MIDLTNTGYTSLLPFSIIVLLSGCSRFLGMDTFWNIQLLPAVFTMIVCCFLFIVLSIRGFVIQYKSQDIFLLSLLVWMIFNNSDLRWEQVLNPSILLLATFGLFYLFLRGCFNTNHLKEKGCILFILLGFINICLCLATELNLFSVDYKTLPFSGIFFNPAFSAAYSAALLPLVVYFFFKSRSRRLSWLVALSVLVFFMLACDSRAAIVGVFFVAVLECIRFIKTRFSLSNSKKVVLSVLGAVLLLILTSILYSFRKPSANGRLFIWKLSLRECTHSLFLGNGSNYLQHHYNQIQAEYFMNQGGKTMERINAREVYIVFNEVITLLVNHGVVGLALAGLLCVSVIRIYIQQKHYTLYRAFCLSLFILFIFSCFSYPGSEILLIIFSLFSLSGSMESVVNYRKMYFCSRRSVATVISLTVMLFVLSVIHLCAVQRWIYASKYWIENKIFATNEYAIILPCMKYNEAFLYQYLSFMISGQEYNDAIHLYTSFKQYFVNSTSLYLLLAEAYYKTDQFEEAEYYYRLASFVAPTKLSPQYLLMKFYASTQQYDKAKHTAKAILITPIIISTPAAKLIKEESTKFLIERK